MLLAVALVVGVPDDALAQANGQKVPRESRITLGGTVSTKLPSDGSGLTTSIRPSIWFGQSHEGWGFKYGLNWFSTETDWPVANQVTDGGKLNIRPLMAGYGYTHIMGRTSVSAKVLGGYAFTSFSLNPGTERAYQLNPGITSVEADSSNTFVLKPEISAWVDLGNKFGLHMSTGYMIARPLVSVKTSAGLERRERIDADRLQIKIGIGYSVF